VSAGESVSILSSLSSKELSDVRGDESPEAMSTSLKENGEQESHIGRWV